MIYVPINEPEAETWGDGNPYVTALGCWKDWCSSLGLKYISAGSERGDLEPGQWCIKSYCRSAASSENWFPRFPRRMVCFHEQDRHLAILFKLRWG
jgi:hypothetical protein